MTRSCGSAYFDRETEAGKNKRQALHVENIFTVLGKFVEYFEWCYGEERKYPRPNEADNSDDSNPGTNTNLPEANHNRHESSVAINPTPKLMTPEEAKEGRNGTSTDNSDTPKPILPTANSLPNVSSPTNLPVTTGRKRGEGKTMQFERFWETHDGSTSPSSLNNSQTITLSPSPPAHSVSLPTIPAHTEFRRLPSVPRPSPRHVREIARDGAPLSNKIPEGSSDSRGLLAVRTPRSASDEEDYDAHTISSGGEGK